MAVTGFNNAREPVGDCGETLAEIQAETAAGKPATPGST